MRTLEPADEIGALEKGTIKRRVVLGHEREGSRIPRGCAWLPVKGEECVAVCMLEPGGRDVVE